MSTDWFFQTLTEHGAHTALIWRNVEVSYRTLLDEASIWRERLKKKGVKRGACVAIEGDYSPQTVALLLALAENANVVVPLAREEALRARELCDLAEVEARFVFEDDDSWQLVPHTPPGPANELIAGLRESAKPGLVVFTSGSTGEPKGILHDLERVLDKFRETGRPWRSVIFLLLDHLGGLNTLFYLLRAGGTVVCLADRTPQTVCEVTERHRVQLLPTSPTFLNMLLISRMYEKFDLSSIELVTYGTEPMPTATLKRLNEVLSAARIKQTYGLSELGVFSTRSRGSDSLWMKVGGSGVETKVVDGVLWVKSSGAMIGYINAPSPFDEEGWLNTGDQVELDGEYMRVLGRTSDLINVGGQKVFPSEVESVLLEVPNVRDVLVFGKPNPVTGNVVAATVTLDEAEDHDALVSRIWEHCQGRLSRYKIPAVVTISEEQEISQRFKKIRRG